MSRRPSSPNQRRRLPGSLFLAVLGLISLALLLVSLGLRLHALGLGQAQLQWVTLGVWLGFCGLGVLPLLWMALEMRTRRLEAFSPANPEDKRHP